MGVRAGRIPVYVARNITLFHGLERPDDRSIARQELAT